MNLPPPITVAIVAVAVLQLGGLHYGLSVDCVIQSSMVAMVVAIGSYVAHKRQLRKDE